MTTTCGADSATSAIVARGSCFRSNILRGNCSANWGSTSASPRAGPLASVCGVLVLVQLFAYAFAKAEAVNMAHDREHVCRLCERENVRVGLANLRTFPWIAEREKAGRLALHGWYFDITKGELYRLNALDEFELVPPRGE